MTPPLPKAQRSLQKRDQKDYEPEMVDDYTETVFWTQLDSCMYYFKAVVTACSSPTEFQAKSTWAAQMGFCFFLFLKENTNLGGYSGGSESGKKSKSIV